MKRWIGVLTLVLVLSGCGSKTPQTPHDTIVQTPVDPEPGLYIAESAVETETGGAVKAYGLGEQKCRRLAKMGDHHLLLGEDSLTLLKGENLTESVIVQIPGLNVDMLRITDDGVAYHDKQTGSVVFLNNHLRKERALELPEEVIGDICISPDWKQIYYCTGNGISVLDTSSGVARVLLANEANWQGISGSFQNGTILRCSMYTQEEASRTILIDTETGAVLAEGDYLTGLTGSGSRYYLEKQTSDTIEYIFGTGNDQPSNFFPTEPGTLFPLPDSYGILQQTAAEDGVVLNYYDLNSGLRTANVKLPETAQITCVGADESAIWFTCDAILYCWDTAQSTVDDKTVYTAWRYTREDPDEEGLQTVGDRLLTLEQRYGVKFHYWAEPEGMAPWNYSFETEYIPEMYEAHLSSLESAMGMFPDNFFQTAAQWTESGALNIILVRGIYGGPDPKDYTSASGIQYNLEGETYIALSLQEGLDQNFCHVLGHLIDARVLSTCNAYSQWDEMNPWDFQYDNDYVKNQDRTDTKYLEGDRRYFIDFYSMSFAVEDRARILEYACMPGNEALFASRYMQKKLQTVCSGIREAFDLPEGEYVWKQYLNP